MTDSITIQPTGPLRGSIRPPGSKSITNRALVCAALARGASQLGGALDSDDTRVMIDGLGRLGIDVRTETTTGSVHVAGCGGVLPVDHADLFVGNSGTTVRFLTAMTCLGRGQYRLDGVPRMRERPIADLLDALNQLGAMAVSQLGTGAPPVIVHAAGLRGGIAQVAGNISSQYLSGLLMSVPYAAQGVTLQVDGDLVSQPYIRMTLEVMRDFGVTVDNEQYRRFVVPPGQQYQGRRYTVEPDASAASYFWAAAAITGGCVRVEGLSRDALQGDVRFCECLQQMGCGVSYEKDAITVTGGRLRGIDVNMNDISDTVQTMAAVAVFAEGATRIRDVGHIRHKETDRIGDLVQELRKTGTDAKETPDGLIITPGALHPAVIETYDDHRMAMGLSLIGLRVSGINIRNPGCTAKTYPEFFNDLRSLSDPNQY